MSSGSLAKVWSQYLSFQRGVMWIPNTVAVLGLALDLGLNLAWIPSRKVGGAAAASACSHGLVMCCTGVTFVWMGRRG